MNRSSDDEDEKDCNRRDERGGSDNDTMSVLSFGVVVVSLLENSSESRA